MESIRNFLAETANLDNEISVFQDLVSKCKSNEISPATKNDIRAKYTSLVRNYRFNSAQAARMRQARKELEIKGAFGHPDSDSITKDYPLQIKWFYQSCQKKKTDRSHAQDSKI